MRAPQHTHCPGTVVAIRGVIFQNDGQSTIGRLFIRPLAALDRFVAGVRPSRDRPPLAMHAGLHVALDDGREVIAEQLVGPLYFDFVAGLSWTPIEDFRKRDRGGWDVTVPATAFRGVDAALVARTAQRMNEIQGRPFLGEDCTAFIERAFERRLFADSPVLRALGFHARVGDPALPLLDPDAELDERTRRLLHVDAICRLPDALAHPLSPNARLWAGRLWVTSLVGAALGFVLARRR